MAHGKPFSLFKRNRIYYCQFKDGKKWTTAKSTGQTSKGEAETWAFAYLTRGSVVLRERVTFNEFIQDFFAWEGPYAMDKRARGLRINERWCRELGRLTDTILAPTFGPSWLVDIDEISIETFRNSLYRDGYSGSYINKALIALKAILTRAKKMRLIQTLPEIDKAANRPKPKGILSIDEARLLCGDPWRDNMARVGNLLALTTGLRLSEILALTVYDIHPDGFLTVRRSWDSKLRRLNDTTKNGRVRHIVLASSIVNDLKRLIEENPYVPTVGSNAFIFYGDRNDRPVDEKYLTRALYRALRAMGIDEHERKQRNITFHSHRHFFNSFMIDQRIPLQKIQALTGHLTQEMTQHYYHPGIDDMNDIRAVQDSIYKPSFGNDDGTIIQ